MDRLYLNKNKTLLHQPFFSKMNTETILDKYIKTQIVQKSLIYNWNSHLDVKTPSSDPQLWDLSLHTYFLIQFSFIVPEDRYYLHLSGRDA